jgi:hypothetical protein
MIMVESEFSFLTEKSGINYSMWRPPVFAQGYSGPSTQ